MVGLEASDKIALPLLMGNSRRAQIICPPKTTLPIEPNRFTLPAQAIYRTSRRLDVESKGFSQLCS